MSGKASWHSGWSWIWWLIIIAIFFFIFWWLFSRPVYYGNYPYQYYGNYPFYGIY